MYISICVWLNVYEFSLMSSMCYFDRMCMTMSLSLNVYEKYLHFFPKKSHQTKTRIIYSLNFMISILKLIQTRLWTPTISITQVSFSNSEGVCSKIILKFQVRSRSTSGVGSKWSNYMMQLLFFPLYLLLTRPITFTKISKWFRIIKFENI